MAKSVEFILFDVAVAQLCLLFFDLLRARSSLRDGCVLAVCWIVGGCLPSQGANADTLVNMIACAQQLGKPKELTDRNIE